MQGAIDSYVLGIAPHLETSLPTGMENVSIADSGAIIQRPSFWTEWGAVFPTAAYIHNEFYDGVGTHPFHYPPAPGSMYRLVGLCSTCWFISAVEQICKNLTRAVCCP